LRGGTVIAILSLLLVIWLLTSARKEALAAIAAAAVGLLIYLAYRLYLRRTG
jgi:hypothetical protein